MSKEFVATIGIRPAKVNLGLGIPQVEISDARDKMIETKKSSLKQVMEEVYSNLVKMSDNLKFLQG